jgi:Xaa-Pro aminopeptidase
MKMGPVVGKDLIGGPLPLGCGLASGWRTVFHGATAIVFAFSLLSIERVWAAPSRADARMIEQYHGRRVELRKSLADGITVLFGRTEQDEDLRTGFFQEPNFYYLSGWQEPGAIVLLAPLPEDSKASGYAEKAALPREILFLPERDPDREKWTGRKLGPGDASVREITGFETVMPAEKFEAELRRMLEAYARIYTLTGHSTADRLKQLAPLRDIVNPAPAIAKLRMAKSPEEIALIQRATDATIEAHRAAWRRAGPGLYEYQVAATMSEIYAEKGCERHAYAPIVGSGPNSVYLHYSRSSRRMDAGEVLLMDVGAECAGYASDITRTIPVNGRFTARQREIYEIVLGAQKAAIAAVKPGMTLSKTAPNTLYKIAYDYINSHGKDLHGERLGKYFTHGLGHHVGLDVHDASDPAAPLEAGMVITIEPGIYIPEENLGVRIEDMVLVTEHGSKVMSSALPREPGEIEKEIGRATTAR